MRSYHVTITMRDGSTGTHCDRYPDGAAAARRATDLFPDAAKINVLRLTTLLARGLRAPAMARRAQR